MRQGTLHPIRAARAKSQVLSKSVKSGSDAVADPHSGTHVIPEGMPSAGTPATGVAHQINNPLAVAITNIEFMSDLLVQYAKTASDARDASRIAALVDPMRDSREALERIRDIVRELEMGSFFRAQRPAVPGERAVPVLSSGPPAVARRARVLVVDDEVALCRILVRALEDDHDVEAVSTGKEALARITAGERFDVILSDLLMPEMTGMELHQRLQQVAPDQARRTVFLTGGAFTATARAFLDKVSNLKAEKPLQQKDLLAVIARTLAEQAGT
jgi:CheY-like chemotaxis protein